MAENALKLDGHNIKGAMLRVFISKNDLHENKEDLKRTIFVRNLPLSCTEEKLRQHFGPEGIEEVRLIRDEKGKVKGFAYI